MCVDLVLLFVCVFLGEGEFGYAWFVFLFCSRLRGVGSVGGRFCACVLFCVFSFVWLCGCVCVYACGCCLLLLCVCGGVFVCGDVFVFLLCVFPFVFLLCACLCCV